MKYLVSETYLGGGNKTQVMQALDLRSRMEANGWRILSMPPKETEAFVRAEVQKWPAFLREAGVKAQ